MLSNVAYLHDPLCVSDPEEFRPRRWLRGENREKIETIPHAAFLPFGIGSRMCLGKRFAEQILYLGLIKLVQNYEMTLIEEPGPIKYEVFPTTDKPLRINFSPRGKTM
ncbi:cytochrome P450 10 [Aplysia californica]|uniref:Cytochrome P450 10 n=1 Tax=Aplysia californica TaxID=6500 RepID=A0ABM0JGY9_APLCA|nr:cytochrome P450 10 [Aplysia californica]